MSPPNSRWSSLVFFSVLLHLSHACLISVSFFCSAFSAFNSLQILQVIHCKSLWDPTCLVSWGDKCFSLCKLGFTDLQFSVQPNFFGTTEICHSVPPTLQSEKQIATCSTSLLIQLHSMNLVLYKHHIFINALCCDSRIKPIHDKFQKPFLEIDVKGGERDHIKAYHLEREITSEREYHLLRGREIQGERERDLQGERILVESISQGSQMLGVQEERCHMSSSGERHVHVCLFALVCISSNHSYLSALIFCSLSSPGILC